jgi:hypothetical protein
VGRLSFSELKVRTGAQHVTFVGLNIVGRRPIS